MTDDYIRQLQLERSELIDLLSQARLFTAQLTALLNFAARDAEGPYGRTTIYYNEALNQTHAEAQAFLDAGLFGDKGAGE